MTIRAATKLDIPRLVEMGQRFRGSSKYATYLADNPERMTQLGIQLLAQDGLYLAERAGAPVGMFGSILHDHFISGERFSGEVFWWVEPEFRGDGIRLLRDAECRSKSRGAVKMQMVAPDARVAALYERLGYEFVESSWQKTL